MIPKPRPNFVFNSLKGSGEWFLSCFLESLRWGNPLFPRLSMVMLGLLECYPLVSTCFSIATLNLVLPRLTLRFKLDMKAIPQTFTPKRIRGLLWATPLCGCLPYLMALGPLQKKDALMFARICFSGLVCLFLAHQPNKFLFKQTPKQPQDSEFGNTLSTNSSPIITSRSDLKHLLV